MCLIRGKVLLVTPYPESVRAAVMVDTLKANGRKFVRKKSENRHAL